MRRCPYCNAPTLDTHQFCPGCGGDLRRAVDLEAGDAYSGMTIGSKFILRELIGTGGMGKVYRADQIGVGRTVAVKIMHRHLLGDETAAARFTNEARAASHLNHPNSISVLDFGQSEVGLLYIAMEYLWGRSLDVVLQREWPISFGRIAKILCQAMDAVEAAHALNIIHRDLKPENIFLEQTSGQDFVKVLDFGIAKMLDLEDRSITTPGLVPGTPEYMSPEQARGEPLDPRSDIYSLGVILYELLTGSVPFKGPSALVTMMSHVQDPVEPPSQRCPKRNIPDALDSLVLWALTKKASERIPSASQFRDILSAWAEVSGIWPVAEEKRATQTNILLQYFEEEQVYDLPEPAGQEVLVKPSSTLKMAIPRTRTITGSSTNEEIAIFGRDAEQQILEDFIHNERPGRVLRIAGPLGAGKSTLIASILPRAVKAGMEVINCHPSMVWTKIILGPVRRVALSCLHLPPRNPFGEEDILLAASQINLDAEDVPGIKELFGFSSYLAETDISSRKRERAAAFRRLIHRFTIKQPLLLVFQEIDKYDEPSRELILSLVASTTNQNLALIITHSPDYTQLWPPEVELLKLQPLASDSSESMIRSLFAHEVDDDLMARIHRTAKGQPLFIEQMAFAEVHEGITDPPAKVADLVAARVEHLPKDERTVLQWIATLDDWINVEDLSRLVGADVNEQLLEQLVLKGFLRCHRKYYGFMHHLLAIVVYSSIPAEVRRHIHHDLAEYLRETEAPVTTIAYHSYEGDDGPLAIDELDRAGALAKQCLDLGAASHYYSRALDIVRREWGRGRLRETDLDQMAVDLARRLAEVLQRKGDTLAARGVLEETLSVAAAEESSRASLRLDLGRIDLELGNLQRALRHFELAYSDAEQADSPWLLGEVSRELARVVGLLNDTDRAMDLLIKSLVNSDMVSGSKQGPSWNTFWEVATICTQNGFLERSRGYLLDALEQAENERSVWGKLKIVTGMAEAHLASSEWSEAEMRLTQALDLVTQVGDRTRKTKLLIELGRVYRIQGQVELGRKMLESAVRYAKALSWWEGLKQADREIDMLKFAIPQAL